MKLINVNKTWLNLLVVIPLRFYKDLPFFFKMGRDTFISRVFWLLSIGQSLDRLVLFHDFYQSSFESNNLGDMALSYDSTTISLLPIINLTLIKDIGKKDIGVFCCYSLVIQNYTYNTGRKCTGLLHPVP